MELNGRGLELRPETIGVLLPGQVQSIRALNEEWEYCWWTLDGPLVEETISGFGFESGIYQAGAAPTVLIKELDYVIQRPGRRHELEASAIAYELLCQAARYSRPQRKRQIEDSLVNAAVDVILRSWQNNDFGVGALADSLDTHRSSLSRRFKKATGNTLIEYINALRMHHAAHLLRLSDEGIAEIAHQCGFRDANYFSKQFSARFGMPPSSVRKGSGEG
jgi:AraC-like DNA-binding protein